MVGEVVLMSVQELKTLEKKERKRRKKEINFLDYVVSLEIVNVIFRGLLTEVLIVWKNLCC